MGKIPECDRCRFNLYNPYLLCHDYPGGIESDTCPHFAPDPDAKPEELWEPEGASYYNGELILQPQQHLTREEQLELLNTHPLFTGRCPHCEMPIPYLRDRVHYDCSECGWMDDTV